MSEQAQPLLDPKAHPTFLEDRESVENALAHARRFATKEPFRDRKEAGEAADAIKALGNARRDTEQHKLGITAEWRASTNAVNTEYKELQAPLGAAEAALKQKGLAFKKAEEARADEQRRQEQAELDRKAEEAAAEAQAAAEVAAEDPADEEMQQLAAETRREAAAAAVAPPAPAFDPPKQLRGGFSSLSTRLVWKHEITDAAQVPAAHKIVNEASIKGAIAAEKAAAKAEGRPFKTDLIPGMRIFSEEIPVSR